MIEYKKKSYAMKAEVVAIGTEIYNFLEDCHYTTNESKCVKAFLMAMATLSSLQTKTVSLTLTIRGLSTAWCLITPMHLLTAKL